MSTMIEDTAATPEITAGDRPKANKKPARAKHGAPSAPAKGKSWKKGQGRQEKLPRREETRFRGQARQCPPREQGSDDLGAAEAAGRSQLQGATGWQPHSVRGFLSGTLRKKMGLEVVSAKDEDGEHTYSIES
jgi:hypothetical protein